MQTLAGLQPGQEAAAAGALSVATGSNFQISWWEMGWFKEWERAARPEK